MRWRGAQRDEHETAVESELKGSGSITRSEIEFLDDGMTFEIGHFNRAVRVRFARRYLIGDRAGPAPRRLFATSGGTVVLAVAAGIGIVALILGLLPSRREHPNRLTSVLRQTIETKGIDAYAGWGYALLR